LSIDPASEWTADAMDPETLALHGAYFRSVAHGVYLNVRSQQAGSHPRTAEGLRTMLRAQEWASPPFDEWEANSGSVIVVGGTFETVGMGGEVVIEIFVTDGHSIASLVGPGERAIIAAATPSAQRLASGLRFE
jgi:hypothetical protein